MNQKEINMTILMIELFYYCLEKFYRMRKISREILFLVILRMFFHVISSRFKIYIVYEFLYCIMSFGMINYIASLNFYNNEHISP